MDANEFARSRRSVATPYGSIAYVELGQGPAAVFLHGYLMNGYLWHDVIDQLATQRRCIALDLLGHGHTRVTHEQDLSFDAQAAMVESVIDELGFDQIDLVANASGGGIAQIFAANHPERLRTLTLTNCDTHDNWPPPALANITALVKSGGALEAFRSLLANPEAGRQSLSVGFEHPDQLSDETIAAFFAPLVANEESGRVIARFTETFDNIQTVRVEAKLRKLQTPTLILWGTADIFFDVKWAHWLKETIPGVLDVIEVPGAKLFFPAEQPELVAEHVLKLWAAHDASCTAALAAEET